jgi:hypothetical protein
MMALLRGEDRAMGEGKSVVAEREEVVLLLLMQGRCWRAENGRGYGRKKFKPWEGGRREAVQLGEKRKKIKRGCLV